MEVGIIAKVKVYVLKCSNVKLGKWEWVKSFQVPKTLRAQTKPVYHLFFADGGGAVMMMDFELVVKIRYPP